MAYHEGVSGAYHGHDAVRIVMVTFLGIAWYNSLELCVLVFVTFAQYRGLYFYSLLIATIVGVIPYALGFFLKYFEIGTVWVSLVLLTIGWWTMITGQSFVLYSRLHLIIRNQVVLRRVFWMIVTNVILLHIPTTVLTFGANAPSVEDKFAEAYQIMEKVQMSGFFVQETIISSLYIYETIKLLRLTPEKSNRRIVYQLLGINLICIVMDLGVLVLAYANQYVLQTTIKATIYSMKLKLEFAVLGKLVHLVNIRSLNLDYVSESNGYPEFVDPTQINVDMTRPPASENNPVPPPWSLPEKTSDDEDSPPTVNSAFR